MNCHHNYVAREHHYGEDVLVTRKGAVRARRGRARHHPGLDGRAQSYIVRGKGNAGVVHARAATARAARCRAARRSGGSPSRITRRRPQGIECRKDADVIDETPMAYKAIDAVMAAQADLVEIVHSCGRSCA